MKFTNVIFNTYKLLLSSDFSSPYQNFSLSRINPFNLFLFAIITTLSIFHLFIFEGRLNIE